MPVPIVRGVALPAEYTRQQLQMGTAGSAVSALQDLLKAHGFTMVGPSDGAFGKSTLAAVQTFQQSHGLGVDGIVGPNTWLALTAIPAPAPRPDPEAVPIGTPRAQELLAIAAAELGVREEPDGSNGGPRVDEYTGRWRVAWCALWTSWCLRQCVWNPWEKPLAAVVRIRAWAMTRGLYEPVASGYEPIPGDLFVMLKEGQPGVDPSHGHVGIVYSFDAQARTIKTLEGNASNAVRSLVRKIDAMDGFVRICDA